MKMHFPILYILIKGSFPLTFLFLFFSANVQENIKLESFFRLRVPHLGK